MKTDIQITNRAQLIGLLSTTSGYADRYPEDAAEIVDLIRSVGLTVVHPSHPSVDLTSATDED